MSKAYDSVGNLATNCYIPYGLNQQDTDIRFLRMGNSKNEKATNNLMTAERQLERYPGKATRKRNQQDPAWEVLEP